MSLNNNAHTSTPTIVRDAARFVTLNVSSGTTLAGITVTGSALFSGAVEFGGIAVFSGTSASFLNDVTLGATPGDTITFNGLETHNSGATFDCDVNLGLSSADTVTVAATVAQNGPFTASGTNSFTGPTTAASGMDRVLLTSTPIGADISVTWNGTENFLIVSPTTSGLLVRMIADGSTPNNVRKTIKNSYGSGYNITVIDNTTSTTLAVLTPGTETTVVSLSGRWR